MIRFRCAKCGAMLESPPAQVGHEETCPTCGEKLVVPPPRRRIGRLLGWAVISLLALCSAGGVYLIAAREYARRNSVDAERLSMAAVTADKDCTVTELKDRTEVAVEGLPIEGKVDTFDFGLRDGGQIIPCAGFQILEEQEDIEGRKFWAQVHLNGESRTFRQGATTTLVPPRTYVVRTWAVSLYTLADIPAAARYRFNVLFPGVHPEGILEFRSRTVVPRRLMKP